MVLLLLTLFSFALGEGSVEMTCNLKTVPINSEATITLHTEGATEFQIMGSGGSWWTVPATNGTAEHTLFISEYAAADSLSYMVYAKALVNGNWTEETSLLIPLLDNGQYHQPVIDAQARYQIGSEFTIPFLGCDDATIFDVWLRDATGMDVGAFSTERHEPQMTLDGQIIREKGTYVIEVCATAPGWRFSEKTQKSFVVDGEQEEGPVIQVNTDPILLNGEAEFTVIKPGAQLFDIEYTSLGTGSETRKAEDGEATFQIYIYAAVEHSVNVRAYVNDAWTAWSTYTFMPLQSGKLEAPKLTVSDKLEIGNDLAVTVADFPVDGLCRFNVYKANETESSGYWIDTASGTIPEYAFDEAEVYRIEAYLEAPGWENSGMTTFYVNVSGERQKGPEVTLSDTRIPVNSDFPLSMSLTGAESFEYSLRINGRGLYYGYAQDWQVEDGKASGRLHVYETTYKAEAYEDQAEIWVKALVDGQYTAYTKLPVTVFSNGALPEPKVAVTGEAVLGKDISVTISDCDEAVSYEVTMYKRVAGETMYVDSQRIEETSCTLKEELFESAGTYLVCAEPHAPGWVTNISGLVEIQLEGERLSGPEITCSQGTMIRLRDYEFTLSRPGATKFSYSFAGAMGIIEAEDGKVTVEVSSGWSDGIQTFTAKALVNDVWTATTTKEYDIQDYYGELPEPVLHVPDTLPIGQDLRGWIETDPVVSEISMRLRREDADGSTHTIMYAYFSPFTQEQVLAEDTLFTGSGKYEVEVDVNADGWRPGRASKVITVTGERPAVPTLIVEDNEVILGELLHVRFSAQGATEFEYDFSGYNRTVSADDQNEYRGTVPVDREVYYTDGMFRLRARIGGIWSNWLETELDVKETGMLPAPALSVPKTHDENSDLIFTLGEVEGATDYSVTIARYYVYDESTGAGYWNSYETFYYRDAGEKTISKAYFQGRAGQWEIYATAFRSDYRDFEMAEVTFDVTGGQASPDEREIEIETQPASVKIGDTVTMTMTYPGATRFTIEDNRNEVFEVTAEDGKGVFQTVLWPDTDSYKVQAYNGDLWLATYWKYVDYAKARYSKPFLAECPLYLEAGDVLTLTLPEVDGATAYAVYVYRVLSNRMDLIEHKDFTNAGEVVMDQPLTVLGRYEMLFVPRIPDCDVDYEYTAFAVIARTEKPQSFGDADFVLPSGVLEIQEAAFTGIPAEKVCINDGCKAIGVRAFAESAVKAVWIPASVDTIAENALPEGAVIYTPSGSYAFDWAQQNGFQVVTE